MILALTGAGISAASGIATFKEQPWLRDQLSRNFVNAKPNVYAQTISIMQRQCEQAKPNDAHRALAEYDVPTITMNIDGLHQKAETKHLLTVHGTLPDIVLYGDPAPNYATAYEWTARLHPGDFLFVVGTSYVTTFASAIKRIALPVGADVYEIAEDAEHMVRKFLEQIDTPPCSFEDFLRRNSKPWIWP